MMEKQGFGFHPEKWTEEAIERRSAIEQCRIVKKLLETSTTPEDAEGLKTLLGLPNILLLERLVNGGPFAEIMRPFFACAPSEEQAARSLGKLVTALNGYGFDSWEAYLNGDMAKAWENAAWAGFIGGMMLGDGIPSKKIEKQVWSKLGKAGAKKSNAKWKEVESFVIEKYKAGAGKWTSAPHAARSIKNEVLQFAESVGAGLSRNDPERRIADWIRKFENQK